MNVMRGELIPLSYFYAFIYIAKYALDLYVRQADLFKINNSGFPVMFVLF